MRWGVPFESDLERVITEQRKADMLEALALQAFTAEELAAMPAADRRVPGLLLKRQLRTTLDPSLADALRLRREFEDFCDRQSGNAAAIRLFPALRL